MRGAFIARARRSGKRERTRARLMDAAAEVFAREGIEAASVNEIAHAAEVANGTFYNHFRDKQEIADAVAFAIAREFAERIDASMRDLRDPAERTSYGTRQFVEFAAQEPIWGRAMVRSVWSLPGLRSQVTAFARADLERGAKEGTFRVEIDDLLVDLFMSMVVTAVILRLEGGGPEVGARVAEHQLRMLGVPPARARRAAHRPLEPIVLEEDPPR